MENCQVGRHNVPLGKSQCRTQIDRRVDPLWHHAVEMRRRTMMLPWLALLVCLVPQFALAESIAGKWNLVWDTQGGVRHQVWDISQDGEAVSVETDGQKLEGTFKDGRIELSGKIHAARAGYSAELKAEGALVNGQLKGKGSWGGYVMSFVGERDK